MVGASKFEGKMEDEADILAESQSGQKRWLEELAALPVVEILGVVGPSGASGGKSRGDDHWTLRFTFDAWRLQASGCQTQPLTIRRSVTNEELDRFRGLIRPYAVIRIKARIAVVSPLGSPQALLEDFIGIDTSDLEMNNHADQLQKPVIHEDPVLGTFTLDRTIDWFAANVVWSGNAVSLNLSATETAEIQEALKTAHSLWQSQSEWNRRIREYAVHELLPLKNDVWLGDEEAELTADQFENRIKLQSITVYPDGSFEFWHDDGDLFGGHSIQISGNLMEGPTDADIPG